MLKYVKAGLTEESFWLSTPARIVIIINKDKEMGNFKCPLIDYFGVEIGNETKSTTACYIDQAFI